MPDLPPGTEECHDCGAVIVTTSALRHREVHADARDLAEDIAEAHRWGA